MLTDRPSTALGPMERQAEACLHPYSRRTHWRDISPGLTQCFSAAPFPCRWGPKPRPRNHFKCHHKAATSGQEMAAGKKTWSFGTYIKSWDL